MGRAQAPSFDSSKLGRKASRGRVVIFGIGLAAYLQQFPGLKDRLEGYQREVESRVAQFGLDVIPAGLVDTSSAAAAGREHGHRRMACQLFHLLRA